jgi:hypothetical protein
MCIAAASRFLNTGLKEHQLFRGGLGALNSAGQDRLSPEKRGT